MIMADHDIYFGDNVCSELGAYWFGGNEIPARERDVTEIEVPGRDGVLIQDNGRYKPITIPAKLVFISDDESEWADDYAELQKWLATQGTMLMFSDDTSHFYYCYYAKIETTKREALRCGKLDIQFVCAPYRYVLLGIINYDPEDVLENPYCECHPIYYIKGVGTCTLTVNGNSITAYVTSKLYIDTERMIAYTSDDEVSNTSVSGNYDELWLAEGTNTIEITDDFTLKVTPYWRE